MQSFMRIFPAQAGFLSTSQLFVSSSETYLGLYPIALPIEERVFFREGKGISATNENYRVATSKEIEEWKEFQKKQEEIEP